jgi:hypothetical protein
MQIQHKFEVRRSKVVYGPVCAECKERRRSECNTTRAQEQTAGACQREASKTTAERRTTYEGIRHRLEVDARGEWM